MIKWNEEYKMYITDDGHVYNREMHEYCYTKADGYCRVITRRQGKSLKILVHRAVWETFVGEIPNGYQIDHINHIRDDNRLDNLRCVTPLENLHNRQGKIFEPRTDFGWKFKEHFGINKRENTQLYSKEYYHYCKTGKCSWE